MKRLALVLCASLACPSLWADTIQLQNGSTPVANDLKRDGDMLMTTVTMANGSSGSVGYHISDIKALNLSAPVELAKAEELLAAGKADQALTVIEPAVTFQQALRDIPGNWWAKVAVMRLAALSDLGKTADAAALAHEIETNSKDPEILLGVRLQTALTATYSDPQKAMTAFENVVNQSSDPQTLSRAWLKLGDLHMEQHEFDDALMAYLAIKVFYPEHNMLLPKALWGSGQAYEKLKDPARASQAYQVLAAQYPQSPEATLAGERLKKLKPTQ